MMAFKSLRLHLTAFALLLTVALGFGANPANAAAAYVGSTFATNLGVVRTPTAGNDMIVQVIGIGGASALTSLTDSVGGDTVLTDFAYTVDATSGVGLGVFRVHNVTAVSHTFTPVWATTPTTAYFVVVVEASGISGVDSGAGTISLNTGSSSTPTSETLTPGSNGDFLLSALGQNHFETLGSWTNGFATTQASGSGPTWASGYLVQGTAGAVNAGLGTGAIAWANVMVAYSATGSGGPSAALVGAATDSESAAGSLTTSAGGYAPILLDDPGHVNGTDNIFVGTPPGGGQGDNADVAFLKLKQWAADINKMTSQLFPARSLQTPTTGFTITLGAGITQLVLNPAGVLPTGTVVFPPNPADNQPLVLMSSQTVTALTQSTSDGSSINGAPSGLAANLAVRYRFILSLATWFREQ